jgi:hypothetical protein
MLYFPVFNTVPVPFNLRWGYILSNVILFDMALIYELKMTKHLVRGASKIKLKNVNKKRMAAARRLFFLEFLKASIADLITLFFSSLQNSEGGGNSDSGDSFAGPCQFLPFGRPKFNFQPLSFTFETFGKKLAETKIVARVNVKKIKAKE